MNKELIKFLEKSENKNAIIIPLRILKEKTYYLVHYLINLNNNYEVHFSYLEGKENNLKIIKQAKTSFRGASKYNGRTQIDGELLIKDLNKTESNKTVVKNFLKNVLTVDDKNKINTIKNYISTKIYYQHNVDNDIGDGINELIRSIKHMWTYGSDLKYDKNLYMLGQGNFVFIISQQYWLNPKNKKTETWEYYDLFRLEASKIIEHWDIIKQIK